MSYVGADGSWGLDMTGIKFDTVDELNNVMEQLPPETRELDSGFVAKQLEDGKYELTVPTKWAGAVRNADPKRPPLPERRAVPKSLVISRLVDAGKINEAFTALMDDPALFARWFSPDRHAVNSDDPDTIAFLEALDVDPDAILAIP